MFTRIYARHGLNFHFVDMTNPQNIADKINSKTKLIWIETPTNPLMKVVDIQAVPIWPKEKIFW